MTSENTAPARPRRATPRPVYDQVTVILQEDAASHLWGDPDSGFVSDRVYSSSDVLHVLRYELGPGRRFVHSPTNPTVFAADVTYIVLEGTLWAADPEHGEVRPVTAGEVLFYRRDTWHHVFNPSDHPVRVLEFFAPPPSRGTASTYAKQQPMLSEVRYDDHRWAGRWPEARAEYLAAARLHVLGEDSLRWRLIDDQARHVEGVAVDTEHLTVARGRVMPGHLGQELVAVDESLIFLEEGALYVLLPDAPEGEQAWFPLTPGDAVFLPAGSCYRLVDQDGVGGRYWMGSARPVPSDWTP
ncbi:cupin domain-containing protein [Aeromicrobium sp. CTD01-1L150]|uniref:cupin domain-containing protein n=1 Tax=Aeromicrobium sp. CTD01-1L150 TaxID=3341830 RepID=UPI0035C20F94